MMYGISGFGMVGGWLMMLLWIVILVAVVYLVIHGLERNSDKNRRLESDAEQILRERFAKGEIDLETYQKMREMLRKR